MIFVPTDAGRSSSRYPRSYGDCVIRAVAVATFRKYDVVFEEVAQLENLERVGIIPIEESRRKSGNHSSPYQGVFDDTVHYYLARLGFLYSELEKPIRFKEISEEMFPSKTSVILNLTRHVVAVMGEWLFDEVDFRLSKRQQKVLGFWHLPQ